MDWLTFISKLVDSLAWPIAVVIAVLLLRTYIKEFLPYLSKLKYGDLEAEFKRELGETKELVKKSQPSMKIDDAEKKSENRLLYSIADQSPRDAVIGAWVGVERAARNLIWKRHLIKESTELLSSQIASILVKSEVLDQAWISVYYNLRRLRNEAAHAEDFSISSDRAYEYTFLAYSLVDHLNALAENSN